MTRQIPENSVFLRLTTWLPAAVLVFIPALAFAFSVTTIQSNSKTIKRWKKTTVPYYLHPSGSADLQPKAALDAIRQSFQDWQNVDCTSLKFTEGYHCNTALGKCLFNSNQTCKSDSDCNAAKNTSVLPIAGKYNKRNELVWVETSQWKHGTYVLGVTVAITDWSGNITESDIAFNGYQQKWTNDPYVATKNQSTQHVKSVAIHEIGHFFGVHHMLGGWKQSDPPTMAPNVQPNGLSASINADDKKAICFLNPKSGSYTCKNDSDCPYINHKNKNTGKEYYAAKLKCQSGKCIWGAPPAGGQTAMGGQCAATSDCSSGGVCVPLSSTLSLCSKQCTTSNSNCGGGFYCHPSQQGGTQGYCLPNAAKWDGQPKKAAEDCLLDYMCESKTCYNDKCRITCSPSQPAKKCDLATETCDKLPNSSVGVCIPKNGGSGGPKLKKVGDECFDLSECETTICMKENAKATAAFCRASCTGPGTCGDNQKCVDQGEGYQGCVPGQEVYPTGAPCKLGKECTGGHCIVSGDEQFCSNTCKLDDPLTCPCGMECQDKGQGPLCFNGKPVACLEAGDSCTSASECKSGLCPVGSCLATCDVVAGPVGCPADEAGCQRLESGKRKGRCLKPGEKSIGSKCADDSECTTLLCAADPDANGGMRCIRPCDPQQNDCGTGLFCHAVNGEIGVCAKAALGSGGGLDAGGGGATADDVLGPDTVGGSSGGVTTGIPASNRSGCSASQTSQRFGGGQHAAWLLGLAVLAVVVRRKRLLFAVR